MLQKMRRNFFFIGLWSISNLLGACGMIISGQVAENDTKK